MAYCEDYPCCGHTPQDPCERQWYDEPDAFDTRKNPHALCDHENGECNVEEDEWEEDEDDEVLNTEKPYSQEDYDKAWLQGLDLDVWSDYQEFYQLGEPDASHK